jgi:hypothetical protein
MHAVALRALVELACNRHENFERKSKRDHCAAHSKKQKSKSERPCNIHAKINDARSFHKPELHGCSHPMNTFERDLQITLRYLVTDSSDRFYLD